MMHLLRLGYVLLFLTVANGCTHSQVNPLVSYELSGGIAGHAKLVAVNDDGEVTVRDRMKSGVFRLSEDEVVQLKALCAPLNQVALPDQAQGAAQDAEEEPECCDLIVERVIYQGTSYALDQLDESLAAELRAQFELLLARGLAAPSVEDANVGESADVITE